MGSVGGAYVALALYVNKKLSYSSINPRFWSTEDAQRRWKSLYSSYVDALKEEDKGNSLAGVVRQTSDKQAQHCNQPAGNSASQLARGVSTRSKQIKKCASFEVLHELYSEHPSVKSVRPKEVGGIAKDDPEARGCKLAKVTDTTDDTSGEGEGAVAAPTPAQITSSRGGAAAPAAIVSTVTTPSTATKAASSAAFALKPSKLPPKMDLGNAYLEAQVMKAKALAESNQQEMKVKIMMSLIATGKTFAEITEYLKLV